MKIYFFVAGSERGTTHADTFLLQEAPGKWKWTSTKPGGRRPTPRSGVSCVTAPNGKVVFFFFGIFLNFIFLIYLIFIFKIL